jgi:hypothetical protein
MKKKSVLQKTYPFLKIVSKMPKQSRKTMLKETNGDMDILRSLKELGVNAKLGNLKLNPKKLKKHLPYINELVNTDIKTCSCAKRKKLIQKGEGFLPLVISALPAILDMLFRK